MASDEGPAASYLAESLLPLLLPGLLSYSSDFRKAHPPLPLKLEAFCLFFCTLYPPRLKLWTWFIALHHTGGDGDDDLARGRDPVLHSEGGRAGAAPGLHGERFMRKRRVSVGQATSSCHHHSSLTTARSPSRTAAIRRWD